MDGFNIKGNRDLFKYAFLNKFIDSLEIVIESVNCKSYSKKIYLLNLSIIYNNISKSFPK